MDANWFIGLRVKGGAFVTRLVPPAQVRLFGADDLHMTVAFLGKAGEERARASFEHAGRIALPALSTELGGVVALGARRRPSAFASLPTRLRPEIERAIAGVRDAMCDAANAQRDTRPALAHVTFARPSRRASMSEVREAARWAESLDLGLPTVRVDSIALYTAARDRAQGLFEIRAELPLAASFSEA